MIHNICNEKFLQSGTPSGCALFLYAFRGSATPGTRDETTLQPGELPDYSRGAQTPGTRNETTLQPGGLPDCSRGSQTPGKRAKESGTQKGCQKNSASSIIFWHPFWVLDFLSGFRGSSTPGYILTTLRVAWHALDRLNNFHHTRRTDTPRKILVLWQSIGYYVYFVMRRQPRCAEMLFFLPF